jgi:hypothetical protein
MLHVAASMRRGTILWIADGRAAVEHVVPRITKTAAEAGRAAPRIIVGVPDALCPKDELDGAREWANRVLGLPSSARTTSDCSTAATRATSSR